MTKLRAWKMACAVSLLGAATAGAASAQAFRTLLSFEGSDGYLPVGGLAQGTDGSLYGTTSSGGDFNCNPPRGCGTVFRISRGGIEKVLHIFGGGDGAYPAATPILATDGSFYGTTENGGPSSGACPVGCGTIFRMTPNGELETLSSFGYGDGAYPVGGLAQANAGTFYGTTSTGGSNGWGTVFEVTSAGMLTTLYNFCGQANCLDGALPVAGLVRAMDGNFYGTTASGGVHGVGTVFKVTTAGSFTVLASVNDGYYANGLIQATNGNLYGTTQLGDQCFPAGGCGTVFQVTLTGDFTTIYNFCVQSFDNCTDGANPYAGLVQADDGNFYGTTYFAGVGGGGTIFGITPGGSLTTIHSFCSGSPCPNGAYPADALVQATNGKFYGTTEYGGTDSCNSGCGTVFSLSTGLPPFVSFVQAWGKVGQTGVILGQGFTGTTSVSLNGTPAVFTVKSDTFLEATVPAGATTGYVTVNTPSGTLTSNVPFNVIP